MNGSVPLDERAVGASDCWVAAGAAALDWVEAIAVPVLVAPLEAGALLAAGAELLDELLGAGVDGLLAAGVVWLASGSTYCWLPADCARAAAGASSASAASTASTVAGGIVPRA